MTKRFGGSFEPALHMDRMDAPVNMRNTKHIQDGDRVFVCSMADLFGDWVPEHWIDLVLQEVVNNPQWTFLFLTKNPKRYKEFCFPDNAWIGATVDRQTRVRPTEIAMDAACAKIKFVSCEPLLEQVHFNVPDIFDWFIIGAKSEGKRKVQPEKKWTMDIVRQAHRCGKKVWMKDNLSAKAMGIDKLIQEQPL
jgi:protein gp37